MRNLARRGMALAAIGAAACLCAAGIASGATLPNFQESVAMSGFTNPVAVRFSSDGRVFVGEKSGLIKVFDGLADPTPTVFADLRTNVYNFWDRGLLGLALHPDFPATPYVYALYAYDAAIGGVAPRWGTPGAESDPCPTPPGATTNGCVVSARLSRLQAAGNVMTGPEQVLVNDWCQQFPSHSVGSIAFGPDGALYVSAGEGASFTFVDSGQNGNACGDPPSEGGALRSQDRRTTGDPASLDGAVLRLDPATGAAMPGNPLGFSSDPNERRMIATGLRNPFRMAFRPGTSELWLGDVGWNDWEEVNIVANATDAVVENFGWPCYEGNGRQAGYDAANLSICENLYAQTGAVTAPFWSYQHSAKVVAGDACPTGSSSASGIAFYAGGAYPSTYNGALFYADYSRDCIWAMLPGANGRPDPANLVTFVAGAANPVELQTGPGGDLFYVDFDGGTIRRVTHTGPPPPSGDKALGRPASASSTEGPGLEPANAVDGLSSTRWGSTYVDGQWWQVDLGSARAVDRVTLTWEFAYASVYQILTSLDGTSFTLAAQQTIGAAGSQTTSFAARNARYVRVLGITRATPYGISLWDAQVFGPPDAPGDATPPTAPTNLAANLVGSTANLSWSAATDNVGVSGYSVHRSTSSGFAPSVANRIAQPSGTSYADSALAPGTYYYVVTARDAAGNVSAPSGQASVTVGPNASPTPTIQTPAVSTTWRVGQSISFSGSATDPEQGALPASALSWSLILHHCPSNCHTHAIQTFPGVASGSFPAPDHDFPSHLELRLTATDSEGQTGAASVELQPVTVGLSFGSNPVGLQLAFGASTQAAPFTRTVIVGSQNSISGPSPQTLAGTSYVFSGWSDGGAQTHTIVAPASPATYTSTFVPAPASGPVAAYGFNETSGSAVTDMSGRGNNGTISGATRTASGRFGRALTFDGVNDWVTVPDSASLDLRTGMTLEAWVRPASGSGWRTVLFKQQSIDHVYALYSRNGANRPAGHVWLGADISTQGTSPVPTAAWTHLASTYDGSMLRLYVNGTQVSSRAVSGLLTASTGVLRIGGNSIFGEFFAGRIDEVRIYDRALSASEIVADRDRAVSAAAPQTLAGGLVVASSAGAVTKWRPVPQRRAVGRRPRSRAGAPVPSARTRRAAAGSRKCAARAIPRSRARTGAARACAAGSARARSGTR